MRRRALPVLLRLKFAQFLEDYLTTNGHELTRIDPSLLKSVPSEAELDLDAGIARISAPRRN